MDNQQFPAEAQRERIKEIAMQHDLPIQESFALVKMGLTRQQEDDALAMGEVTCSVRAIFVFAMEYKRQNQEAHA